jgi:hypothetical protein
MKHYQFLVYFQTILFLTQNIMVRYFNIIVRITFSQIFENEVKIGMGL